MFNYVILSYPKSKVYISGPLNNAVIELLFDSELICEKGARVQPVRVKKKGKIKW